MKKKSAIIELCIVLGLVVVVICSLFRFTYFDGQPGECISGSLFGRFELRNIDKVIIAANGKEGPLLIQIWSSKYATKPELLIG